MIRDFSIRSEFLGREGTFLDLKTARQTATEWNKIGIMNGIGMESFWYFETSS